jgi:hypothetical protein
MPTYVLFRNDPKTGKEVLSHVVGATEDRAWMHNITVRRKSRKALEAAGWRLRRMN